MNKDMFDYIGCYVKDVHFNPPYTMIEWGDGTKTIVRCVDEPYDAEKGFVMAVNKKMFGDEYYKHMKDIIERSGGYKKNDKIYIEDLKKENRALKQDNRRLILEKYMIDDANNNLKSAIESLKKENEKLKESRVMSENRTLTNLNSDLNDGNYELEQKIEDLVRKNKELKQAFYYKNDVIDDMTARNVKLLMRIHKLESENEKYKDIVDMQKEYDVLKKKHELLIGRNNCQAKTISEQRQTINMLDNQLRKIKEIVE